jgi:hypothetical protein
LDDLYGRHAKLKDVNKKKSGKGTE